MPSCNACAAAITRAPKQWAMAGMLAVFAEFEREIIRERVNAGLAQARAARGEARPRSEGLIRPGAQSVRSCSTGGHWQNFRAMPSDISHVPVSYFCTYLGCTRSTGNIPSNNHDSSSRRTAGDPVERPAEGRSPTIIYAPGQRAAL